jgi:hypothetical protein
MNKNLNALGRRGGVLLFLVAALVLGAAGRAQAVDTSHNDRVAVGEVVNDDVLLFGNLTRMDGTVNGTLLASGQDVTINGTVNGDVIVWTNTATINGVINGNLYAAGGTLTVNGTVKGSTFLAGYAFTLGPVFSVDRNLFFAGFSLVAAPGSRVGMDMLAAGYQISLGGAIGRDVLADAGAVQLDGQVGRNVKVAVAAPDSRNATPAVWSWPGRTVPMLPPGLKVAEGAVIGGKLTYTSAINQASAIKAAPAGGTEFILKIDTTASPNQFNLVNASVSAVVAAGRDFLTLMVLGSLALAVWPKLAARVVEQARQKALPAAGWGFVVFFAAYILMGLAALTLLIAGILLGVVTFGGLASVVFGVGFSALGLASATFSLLVSYGSKLVVALLVGQQVLRAVTPRYADNRYWSLAAGALIYAILRDLPPIVPVAGVFLGWLLGALVTLVGLGAMWLVFRDWRAASKSAAALAAVPQAPPAG